MIKLYIISHKFINMKHIPTDVKKYTKIYLVKGYNVQDTDYQNLINKCKKNKLKYIEESKLTNYNSTLQKNKYFAPTMLYHSYINQDIIIDNKYIGIIEYDINILQLEINESIYYNKNITINYKSFNFYNEILKIINFNNNDNFFICLSVRHTLNRLFSQSSITINDKHWLHYFIEDYNKRYKKNYTIKQLLDLYGNKLIPTQQSFLCNRNMFHKISKYVNEFINTHINAKFIPMPSTILERYIGMFIILSDCEKFYIPLQHKATGYNSNYT